MPEENLLCKIQALHARYIRAIDDDRLEDWPELFTETCLYKIVTRENFDQGLPLAVMECRSRGMLRDRVTGYRKINIFEPQRYLRQVSGLSLDAVKAGAEEGPIVRCRSNYLVVRTMHDGAMSIFSAGIYVDKIVLDGDGGALFEERIVIPASRRIETLLVIPL